MKDVIYQVYGRDISNNLVEIDAEENGIHIKGYIGKPSVFRGNRNFETYFVNGRYIKSNIIAKGIEDAYKGYLMQHQYPFCVLQFEMNGSDLDVNVHPQRIYSTGDSRRAEEICCETSCSASSEACNAYSTGAEITDTCSTTAETDSTCNTCAKAGNDPGT